MSLLLDSLASKEGYEKTDTFNQHLRKAAFEKGVPLIGCFELTPRCTLDCKMCYVHLNEKQMYQQELSTENWISLIDEACDAGMMYAVLTGGECLLYHGFQDIYDHLRARGILITILTNGTLLDEDMVAWIAERSPQRIQISVYGSSPEGYERVTGNANAFYKVDKAIDLVKKHGIPFSLAITVSKQILDDFEPTLRYCKAKEPYRCDVTMFPFEARKETGRDYEDFAPSIDEQVAIYKIRLRLEEKSAIPFSCEEKLFEESEIHTDHIPARTDGIQCTAGRIKFSISWDGKMTACNTFGFAEAFPFEDGFNIAWKYINDRACNYHLPAECFECKYKNACIPCPAVHWMASGEGKINPIVCDEAKRMAMEGIRGL
ncbi:MAG: radical SAM protein [Oscillospiraceae bacterium]|nr:radical SAM protein [Oscillospiraceae bacterium]